MDNGTQLGPFYELESSVPARALKQNESIKHIHKTYHFDGEFEELNAIAKTILNIDLSTIVF